MAEGFEGFSVETGLFVAPHQMAGIRGFSVEIGSGIAINPQLGLQGFAIERFVRHLISLTFTDLLGIATGHRLDELEVAVPDGRIFNLGSDIPYGTIPVPYCFYDDMHSGQVKVSGYKRCYWPSAGVAEEYFEYFI